MKKINFTMDRNTYLQESFQYNDKANRQLLVKIRELPEPAESIKLFSHLINCQYKWLARILQDPEAVNMDWWIPVYPVESLETKWTDSLGMWLNYLDTHTESELMTEVVFIGFDGSRFAATPYDIAIQLNNHSIHHRAQMQTLIRQQGLVPDFLDYIGTKYRKLD